MRNIQIPYDLFEALVLYHLGEEQNLEEEIREGLQKKLDALIDRALYTKYRSAPTQEQREQARQEYLDRKGIPQSFRWKDTSSWER